jgi:hypothetical protein
MNRGSQMNTRDPQPRVILDRNIFSIFCFRATRPGTTGHAFVPPLYAFKKTYFKIRDVMLNAPDFLKSFHPNGIKLPIFTMHHPEY